MQNGFMSNAEKKQGKTAVRDYLYTLGGNYGLKKEDVDNIIKYDNDTGEIRLGGINLGKPYSVVDGVSYDDEDKIKAGWNKYAEQAGIIKKPEDVYDSFVGNTAKRSQQQWDENSKNFKVANNELLESLADVKRNITDDTDFKKVYDSVLDKFDYDALVARDNAIAGGASDNGGNIDSYAVNNALRQQAALKSQGVNAAINAGLGVVGQKRSDRLGILDRLTGENQNYFDRQQKNIETGMGAAQQILDNDVKLSETSGYNTGLVKYSHNELFNTDGTLRNVNKDYKADYNALSQMLEETTDAEKRKEIKTSMNNIAEAHNWKVINIPEFSSVPLLPVQKEGTLNRFLGESAERVALGEAEATENAAIAEAQADMYKTDQDNQTKILVEQMKRNDKVIGETQKSNTDSWLSKWLYSPWAIPTTQEQLDDPGSAGLFYDSWEKNVTVDGDNNVRNTTDIIYAARDKLNSKDGYAFCKQELLDAGFTNDQANEKIKEWKRNIAGLEAKRKGITTEEVLENWEWTIDGEVV